MNRRGSLPSRHFKRILARECRKCLRAMLFQDPCECDFSRESLCENVEHVSGQWSCGTPVSWIFQKNPSARVQKKESPRIPAIATFQENPCAECRRCLRAMVVQDPCDCDFSRESLCENVEHVSEQWSCGTPVISIFSKRILVPECRKWRPWRAYPAHTYFCLGAAWAAPALPPQARTGVPPQVQAQIFFNALLRL